jgi:hypothetical protein
MADADPVSWFLIEPGWAVVDSDGDEAGRVVEVLGDTDRDIFTGLAVAIAVFSAPRYLPSENVANIIEGFVQSDLTTPELDELDPYEG